MRANMNFAILCGGLALACVINAASLASARAEDNGLGGDWITADGSTKVRFEPCGGDLCGRIVWLRDAIDPATRQPWRDGKNEKSELRGRPLLGVAMITGLKRKGDGAWSGSLYNPLDGGTYSPIFSPAASQSPHESTIRFLDSKA